MAEQVNIASLTINVDDVVKQSVKLKKELDGIKKSQKELKDSGEESSQAFIDNEVQIKKLSKAYRDNQNFATALEQANEDLTKTMSTQGKSTQQLRDSRSQLNQISKNIIGNTQEEIDQRNKLNRAIDEQTEKIREQSSGFNKAKDKIGEYEQGIRDARDELKTQEAVLTAYQKTLKDSIKTVEKGTEEYKDYAAALNVVEKDLKDVNNQLEGNSEEFDSSILSLDGFVKKAQEGGGASATFAGGLKAGTSAMGGLIKSSLAFIATPIGVILAAIVGAFLLVKNAMNRSEEATSKIKTAFGAFSGIVKSLLKFLQPLGEFLIDGLVKGFELAEKAVSKTLSVIEKGLSFLGFDEASKSVGEFAEKVEEGAAAGKALAKAELALAKAQRESRKIQLDYQKDAEKLRQIRDDETKNIQVRIRANEKLGEVLKKQLNEELKTGQKALDLANLRIQLEGETTDALNEKAEAEAEIADIQERITGQTSEQLTNRVSLQKEAAQKAIDIQNAELDAYLKSQEVKNKSLEESLEIEREAAKAKIKIHDAELKAKLISQEEYNAEIQSIQNNLLRKQAELAADSAGRSLNDYIEANKSKLNADKFLSEKAVAEEKARLEGIAEQKREFERIKLERGIASQQDYNDAIDTINEENRIANEELEKERKEAKIEQQAIDFENSLAIQSEQNSSKYEILTAQLKKDREAEVKTAEKTGANVELINKKYSERQKSIDTELNNAKLSIYAETFGGIAQLLGEQTKAGKAAGIAQATINTFQGVTEVWKAPSLLPEPLNTASKVAATATTLASGYKAIDKISATKTTSFSKGDILKGNSHRNGGIPFSIGGLLGFEAEGGEAIINKKSTAMYSPLLSAINADGGGKRFAGGGIAGSSSGINSGGLIDYDALSTKLADANRSLPAPQVSITEILEVGNNLQVVEDLATS